MARNFLGGFNQPGKPLLLCVREEIVDLYNNGILGFRDFLQHGSNKRSASQSRANTLPSTAQRRHFLVEAVSLTVDLPEVIEI